VSKKFYIASGYKGIKNNMCLEINNRLSVITGLNGAGKTSILKYLYSMHTDKEQVFFRTQNHEDQNQHRWLHRRSSKGFENIMEEIHRRFSKRFTPLSYIDECDMYQILFDAQSCLSEQANSILEDISEFLLSELNVDEQDVKKPLGVPTGADLEKYYKQEITWCPAIIPRCILHKCCYSGCGV
jgi:predicted ATP-dependent endonuclease of OLD family